MPDAGRWTHWAPANGRGVGVAIVINGGLRGDLRAELALAMGEGLGRREGFSADVLRGVAWRVGRHVHTVVS